MSTLQATNVQGRNFIFYFWTNQIVQCVSKNDTALACYNFHVHQPILIIFGRNVAKKASSQKVLYFPTSPNYCCCTIWGNRKPKIASFHLNAESCFASRHRKHIHIITWSPLNRPSFSHESSVCTKEDQWSEYSIMQSSVTTHSTFTKSVVMSIAVSKVGVVPCRASSEKSKDSIGRISYYLNKC